MLLVDDLALLLLDESGTFVLDATHRTPTLAGAVLAELVMTDRVEAVGGAGAPAKARLAVRHASPTGHAVLDTALAVVAERGPARPERLLGPIGRRLEPRVVERLVAAGAVVEQRRRMLGLIPVVRHPVADSTHRRQVLDAVTGALRQGRAPQERTAALVALLSASSTLAKVVSAEEVGLTRRGLLDAGRQVAADDRVAAGVHRALDGINAAVMGAVIATTAATSASAGS